MHQLIHGLVYSSSPEQAVEDAKENVFYPLLEQDVFNYFETLENRNRWNDIPAVALVSKPEGEQLISTGWASTVSEYQHGFKQVEEFLENHEPREFWNDREVYEEYQQGFQKIGEVQGPSTFLYDPEAQGIRTKQHLDHVREMWSEYQPTSFENQELYVVPADIHL